MATVTLHEYVARIEALLQQEAYERVITLCQVGLRSYPRFVDFYRLLGQACLETERPDDAADMFRRVLGVDPQNFVAHVGLGVVAEGMGATDEALWQWERALEMEPNHSAVRDEWKQLRAKRDNTPPAKRVKLNRAGLGYVYLRGEQYERAAGEFRGVLSGYAEDADGRRERFDLQVALAEALYRGGRQREAGELCRQVLKLLPNALKPNLILGDIDLETGREDEGKLLFEHAKLLDPENTLAAQLLHPPVRLPRRDVQIQEPDGTLTFALPAEKSAARPAAEPLPTGMAELAEPVSPEDEGLPDWLRTLRVHHVNVAPSQPERFEADKAPDWLKTIPDLKLVPPKEAPAEPAAPSPAIAFGEPEPPPAAGPAPDAEQPDWLRELQRPGQADVPAAADVSLPAHDALSLELAAAAATPSLQPAAEPGAATAPEDVPDWLADLRQSATALAESPVEAHAAGSTAHSAESPAEAIPDWLAELRKLGAESAESANAAAPEAARGAEAPWMFAPEPPEPQVHAERPGAAATGAPESGAAAQSLGARAEEARAEAATAPDTAATAPVVPSAPHAAMPGDAAAPVVSAAPEPAAPSHADLPSTTPATTALEMAALGAAALLVPGLAASEVTGEPSPPPAATETPAIATQVEEGSVAESRTPHPAAEPSAVAARVEVGPAAESRAAQPAAAEKEEAPAAPSPSGVAAGQMPPAQAPAREVTSFLDDASAPPSVEAQEAPTGAAEYLARLDLARVMKDIDLQSSLELYALMDGAAPELRSQAIAEVAALVRQHPEAEETLQHLKAAAPAIPSETPGAPVGESAHAPQPAAPQPPQPVLHSEGIAYLDDAAAPESIEAQVAPTGAAQYAARLELARMLVDLDLDTALDQYELMVGAEPALLQQAIADVTTLSAAPAGATRTHATLILLQGGAPAQAAPQPATTTTPSTEGGTPEPPAVATPDAPSSHAAQAASAAAAAAESEAVPSVPSPHAAQPVSTVAAESEAVPSVPSPHAAQPVSTVAAELEAGNAAPAAPPEPAAPPRADAVEASGGPLAHIAPSAAEAAFELAAGEVLATEPKLAASAQAAAVAVESARATAVPVGQAGETHLHAAAPEADAALEDAWKEPAAQVAPHIEAALEEVPREPAAHAAPHADAAQPETPEEAGAHSALQADADQTETPKEPGAHAAPPVSAEAPETQEALHEASATGAAPPVHPAPVVSEEAMEPGSKLAAHAPAPAQPVVDASLADSSSARRSPREGVDFLADSAAPASVEAQAAPTGAAAYQARLALARAMHFIDVDEALDQYSQLAGADESVRREALNDLHALLPDHPRAAEVIAALHGPPPPAAARAAEPGAPEWLAEVQTPSPADALVPPSEPVVAEEAMVEAPAASAHPGQAPAYEAAAAATAAPAAIEPVVEETVSQPVHEAPPALHDHGAAEAGLSPVLDHSAAKPELPTVHDYSEAEPELPTVHDASEAEPERSTAQAESAVVHAGAPASHAATAVEPVVEEAAALPLHEQAPPVVAETAPPVSVAAAAAIAPPVEPVIEETAALPMRDMSTAMPEAAAAVEHLAAEGGAPPAAPDLKLVHEALIAAVAPEGTVLAPPEPPPAQTAEPALSLPEREAAEPAMAAPAAVSPPPEQKSEAQPTAPQPAPAGDAEARSRLQRARALQEFSQQESAAQYQGLIDGGLLLPEVIADLQAVVQAQPAARHMRMLLAEAYAQGGMHKEAVEQYRKLV